MWKECSIAGRCWKLSIPCQYPLGSRHQPLCPPKCWSLVLHDGAVVGCYGSWSLFCETEKWGVWPREALTRAPIARVKKEHWSGDCSAHRDVRSTHTGLTPAHCIQNPGGYLTGRFVTLPKLCHQGDVKVSQVDILAKAKVRLWQSSSQWSGAACLYYRPLIGSCRCRKELHWGSMGISLHSQPGPAARVWLLGLSGSRKGGQPLGYFHSYFWSFWQVL